MTTDDTYYRLEKLPEEDQLAIRHALTAPYLRNGWVMPEKEGVTRDQLRKALGRYKEQDWFRDLLIGWGPGTMLVDEFLIELAESKRNEMEALGSPWGIDFPAMTDAYQAWCLMNHLYEHDRDYISRLAMDESLCPMHLIDWACCFDDKDIECAAIREIFPSSHDT